MFFRINADCFFGEKKQGLYFKRQETYLCKTYNVIIGLLCFDLNRKINIVKGLIVLYGG